MACEVEELEVVLPLLKSTPKLPVVEQGYSSATKRLAKHSEHSFEQQFGKSFEIEVRL
jgi:hypothetical protein